MPLRLLQKKNYLTMIGNSVQPRNMMFRNLYVESDGVEKDILDNGRLSCAVFVSSILYINKLISDIHATVERTVEDLLSSGWSETTNFQPGAVLVWEKKDFGDGVEHSHIGFYIGNNKAVSNSSFNEGVPVEHDYTYDNTRKIEKILWHPELDKD